MPRRSSIRQLPDALRTEVDRLLSEGRVTLDDIVSHVRTLGGEVSRSALGRYSQDFEETVREIRETRELARALGRELADMAEGDATPVLVESLHALIFRVRKQLSRDAEVSPKAVADLARAVKDLGSTMKMKTEAAVRLRAEARAELADELKRKLDQATASGGFDVAAAEEARRILGFSS